MRVLYGTIGVFGCLLLPSSQYHQLYAPCNSHTLSIELVGSPQTIFNPDLFAEDDQLIIDAIKNNVTDNTKAIAILTTTSWIVSEVELNLFWPRKKNWRRYNPLRLPNLSIITNEVENDFQLSFVPDIWSKICSGELEGILRISLKLFFASGVMEFQAK